MVLSDFFSFSIIIMKNFSFFMIFCSYAVGAYFVLIFVLAFPISFGIDPFWRGRNGKKAPVKKGHSHTLKKMIAKEL